MRRTQVGHVRRLRNPATGRRDPASRISGIVRAEPVRGGWGEYEYEAWLEEDLHDAQKVFIALPYYRNGRFGGQSALRAPVATVRQLFEGMKQAGWL